MTECQHLFINGVYSKHHTNDSIFLLRVQYNPNPQLINYMYVFIMMKTPIMKHLLKNIDFVSVRVFQRHRTNRMYMYLYIQITGAGNSEICQASPLQTLAEFLSQSLEAEFLPQKNLSFVPKASADCMRLIHIIYYIPTQSKLFIGVKPPVKYLSAVYRLILIKGLGTIVQPS